MLTRARQWTIGLAFVVGCLFGGATRQPGVAEEAAAHADGGKASTATEAGGSHTPASTPGGTAANASTQPRGGDDKNGAQGDAARSTTAPPATDLGADLTRGNEANDSDTRISVQPRRLGGKTDKSDGKTAVQSLIKRTTHPRALSRLPSNPAARNAIGLPMLQHEQGERGPPPSSLTVPRIGSTNRAGIPGSVGAGNKTIGSIVRRPPSAYPGLSVPNRGAISGTQMIRRYSAPAQIGGPQTSVAGVNGTTIRPKH